MSYFVPKEKYHIPREILSKIGDRRSVIEDVIRRSFWNNSSKVGKLCYYVGSYGRGTAIKTSDIDIIAILPPYELERFNNYKYNGQSQLLQSVKDPIQDHYWNSKIKADGQIVNINFSDGISFEILPAFINHNGCFLYPDSNMGGKWEATNPLADQQAMEEKNRDSNGMLYDICKHIRYLRDNHFPNDKLSGIVIDSFIFYAIQFWHWIPKGSPEQREPAGKLENDLLNYYTTHTLNGQLPLNLNTPGSGQYLDCTSSQKSLFKILDFMAYS